MLWNQAGRVVLQGLYFVVIARALGVHDFGAFVGFLALVSIIGPFGSLGVINLLIKHVVEDPSHVARRFSDALGVIVSAGCAITVALVLGATFLASGQIVGVLAAIAMAELLFGRIVEASGAVYQGQERMARTACYSLLFCSGRLLGSLILVAGHWKATLGTWVLIYLVVSGFFSLVILAATCQDVGWTRPNLGAFRSEWREGFLFSVSLASQTVYNDIDKVMLARLASLDVTGVYTAAYRIVDMAFAPMRGVLNAAYPRFFYHGSGGVTKASLFARRLALPAIAYCLLASVGLFVLAGMVPLLLGASYVASVGALRGLAVLPLLKGIHYLAADTLTGAGLQAERSALQVAIAGVNVGLNLVLIPRFSLWGAIASSIACDAALGVGLWLIVWKALRRERDGRYQADWQSSPPCQERGHVTAARCVPPGRTSWDEGLSEVQHREGSTK